MIRHFKKFLREEDGPTAVEYAVMLAMILLACLGAVATVGLETKDLWDNNSSGLQSAFNP